MKKILHANRIKIFTGGSQSGLPYSLLQQTDSALLDRKAWGKTRGSPFCSQALCCDLSLQFRPKFLIYLFIFLKKI